MVLLDIKEGILRKFYKYIVIIVIIKLRLYLVKF